MPNLPVIPYPHASAGANIWSKHLDCYKIFRFNRRTIEPTKIFVPYSGWREGSHAYGDRKAKEKIAKNSFNDTSELLLRQMQKARQDLNDSYKQMQLSEDVKTHQD